MRNRNFFQAGLYLLVLLLLPFLRVDAQPVFPVRAVGAGLIPPHSLILSEYASIKSGDINYIITLNDPVEVSRTVYLRIKVLSNGKEILRSKANFQGPPLVLFQYVPVNLSGLDLAPYLLPENLQGSGNKSTNLLPEGFNQICIEVIDLQRGVAISNEACVSGYFTLFDPPFLDLPACNSDLFMPVRGIPTFFKWQPRHIGIPGAPTMVEYVFELIEVTPGIGNPNDAFKAGWLMGMNTTMIPNYLWLESEPTLQIGKKYAWRVQVKDLGGSQGYFRNKGYSEVCTFNVKPKIVPRHKLSNCSPSNTQYPDAPWQYPEPEWLKVDETVHLGYFDLKIRIIDAQDMSNGASGHGTIYVPFLKTNIHVGFLNMKVNPDNYVMDATYIEAWHEVDRNLPIWDIALECQNHLASKPEKIVSWLAGNGGGPGSPPIAIPIGLDRAAPPTNDVMNIMIYDMQFYPQNASLSAVFTASKLDSNSTVVPIFNNTGVNFATHGPQADGHLTINPGVPDLLRAQDPHMSFVQQETRVEWDCKGAKIMTLKGQYEFEPNQAIPSDGGGGKPRATFTLQSFKVDDFIVKIDDFDQFALPNPFPLNFKVSEGWLDWSLSKNSQSIKFPTEYTGPKDTTYRGFNLPQFKFKFPEEYDFTGTGQETDGKGEANIIDETGMFYKTVRKNLIAIEKGKVGDWRISVDSLELDIRKSIPEIFKIQGKTGPKVSEPTITYQGFLANNQGDRIYDLVSLSSPLLLPLWKSELELDQTSNIGLYKKNGKLEARPNLNGRLKINVTQADIDANPENKVAIDSLRTKFPPLATWPYSGDQLLVDDFRINHPDNLNGRAFYLEKYDRTTPFSLGNASLKSEFILFPEKKIKMMAGDSIKGIGFVVVDESVPFQVRVWGTDPNKDGFYTFAKVELSRKGVFGPDQPFRCDCVPSANVTCAPASTSNSTGTYDIGDVIQMGMFGMLIETPNKGKLRMHFLKKFIDVNFSGLAVNSDYQATAGEATAIFSQDALQGGPDLAAVNFTDQILDNLRAKSKTIEQLPLYITEDVEKSAAEISQNCDLPDDFFLHKMTFRPDGATGSAFWAKRYSQDKILIFEGADFPVRGNGFKLSDIDFNLLKPVQF